MAYGLLLRSNEKRRIVDMLCMYVLTGIFFKKFIDRLQLVHALLYLLVKEKTELFSKSHIYLSNKTALYFNGREHIHGTKKKTAVL